MKKTIAIDIDDVLALTAQEFISYSNNTWGTKLTIEDYHEHWAKLWGVSNQEAQKRSDHFHGSGALDSVRPRSDSLIALRSLKRKYDLVLVTSRRSITQGTTAQWIQLHYPDLFLEIHHADMWNTITDQSNHVTKRDVLEQIGAHYLIDDHLKHCKAAAEAGIDAVLFGNYSWNQAEILPPRVVRCVDWQEVLAYFETK